MTDQLAGFESYAVANWDGYEAEPIMPRTLAAARQFLSALSRSPDVAPGADGSIGFEWRFAEGPMKLLMIGFGDVDGEPGVEALCIIRNVNDED